MRWWNWFSRYRALFKWISDEFDGQQQSNSNSLEINSLNQLKAVDSTVLNDDHFLEGNAWNSNFGMANCVIGSIKVFSQKFDSIIESRWSLIEFQLKILSWNCEPQNFWVANHCLSLALNDSSRWSASDWWPICVSQRLYLPSLLSVTIQHSFRHNQMATLVASTCEQLPASSKSLSSIGHFCFVCSIFSCSRSWIAPPKGPSASSASVRTCFHSDR